MTALLAVQKPDLVILNLVHRQITLSIIDAIKDYDPNLPIIWTMHDLIAVCPSYTMLDGNGVICEKCLNGDFSNCLKNRCTKGSRLMSWLSYREAKYIRKKNWYDKVDLFVCPSEFYREKLEEAGFTKSPIVTRRNPLPETTEYTLNDNDNGYVLYFGRLTKEKGVKTLIEVFKDIDYKLIVLGTGPEEKGLKEYVKDALIENVQFKGFVQGKELTDYIRYSRAVVLPSEWYENGPYSAMETMALGKPLIVSDKGGLPELVVDGENGYVFGSKEQLKEAINKMIGLDRAEYTAMCMASLDKAKSAFAPKTYVEFLENFVNDWGRKKHGK